MKCGASAADEVASIATCGETVDWRLWCRLCAKDDEQNVNVYFRDAEKTWTSVLAVAIGKYFWVNIKMDDDLSNVLCKECYTLVESLIEFSERVSRVQTLFSRLQHAETEGLADVDYELVRKQCGLQSDQWQPIIKIGVKEEQTVNKLRPADVLDEDAEILAEIEGEELLDGDGTSTYENYSVQEEETAEDLEELATVIEPALSHVEGTEILEAVGIDEEHATTEPAYETVDEADVETSSTAADSALIEEDSEQQPCKYKCTQCGKDYKRPMAYKRHMVEAHSVVPDDLPDLSCKRCQRSFPTDAQLTAHYRSHLEPQQRADNACSYCDKRFTTPAALKRHINGLHENLKPFICDCCGKALKTITALNEHKLVHTDECPFECTVCQRRFKNKARLKIHADIHNDNSYECTICGLKLNTRRTFNMHKLVHSDEKQYKCDVCGAAFKRGKTLKSHLILHTGIRPYKCNFCGKDFSNGSNCRMHKRKTHPEELAAEESRGVTRSTFLPMLTELTEASKLLKPQAKRMLSSKMHALLLATEEPQEQPRQQEVVRLAAPELCSGDQQIDETDEDGTVLFEIVEEMECT